MASARISGYRPGLVDMASGQISREIFVNDEIYREELEHFAFCVRHGNSSDYHADKEHQPRCRGEVALADAVIALTSNIAMRQKRRIDFDPKWFDYQSPETPEGAPSIARNG